MNNPSSDVGYLPMGFLVQEGWALRPFTQWTLLLVLWIGFQIGTRQ